MKENLVDFFSYFFFSPFSIFLFWPADIATFGTIPQHKMVQKCGQKGAKTGKITLTILWKIFGIHFFGEAKDVGGVFQHDSLLYRVSDPVNPLNHGGGRCTPLPLFLFAFYSKLSWGTHTWKFLTLETFLLRMLCPLLRALWIMGLKTAHGLIWSFFFGQIRFRFLTKLWFGYIALDPDTD